MPVSRRGKKERTTPGAAPYHREAINQSSIGRHLVPVGERSLLTSEERECVIAKAEELKALKVALTDELPIIHADARETDERLLRKQKEIRSACATLMSEVRGLTDMRRTMEKDLTQVKETKEKAQKGEVVALKARMGEKVPGTVDSECWTLELQNLAAEEQGLEGNIKKAEMAATFLEEELVPLQRCLFGTKIKSIGWGSTQETVQPQAPGLDDEAYQRLVDAVKDQKSAKPLVNE